MGRTYVRSLSLFVRGSLFGGLLFSVASLTACSGGGSGGAPMLTDGKPNFESCNPKNVAELEEIVKKGSAGAGPLADNARKTEWVQSDFFDKPYDRYDIEAVLDASAVTTAMYVRSLGITLHKAPRPDMTGQCPMYFYLKNAPPPLQEVWNENSGGGGNSGLTLAGLFFEFCSQPGTPGCSDRAIVNPTILIDEATERWTLIHEMMHANFNQARKASPTTPPNSYLARAHKGLKSDMIAAYEAFVALPNRGDLMNAAEVLRKRVELGKEIFVRGSLEEVALEGMLTGLWADGKLLNVVDRSPDSGVAYMEFSRDKYFPTLIEFVEIGKIFKKAAEENFWPEIATHIDETDALMKSYKAETQGIIDTAKAKIKVRLELQNGFTRPQLAYFASEDTPAFDVVNHDKVIRAHLASHDQDGLEADFIQDNTELLAAIR